LCCFAGIGHHSDVLERAARHLEMLGACLLGAHLQDVQGGFLLR